MATIFLIRHGTNDSIGKRLVGRMPGIHLNQKGIEQAQALADLLKDFPVKAIFSSPMERTLETAKPLAAILGLPIQVHPELNEADFGDWTGCTFEELQKEDLWNTVREQPASVRFPSGESLLEIQHRAGKAIEEINTQFSGSDLVLCFTHGDIIRLSTAYFLNLGLNDFRHLITSPASITEFRFDEGRFFLIRYNQSLGLETSHYMDKLE